MSAAENIMENSGSGLELSDCIAFIGDNQTHGVVASVLEESFQDAQVRNGSTAEVIEYLSTSSPPSVLIVDISDAASPLTAMMSLTAAMTDETRIIGVGSVNDISLYREIIDAGATVTAPPLEIQPDQSPFIQLRWRATGMDVARPYK